MLFYLQFWLLLAIPQWCGHSPPNTLCATCLVGVSAGWPMVFHSLCEMRVMFKAVSLCNRTEWPFNFTDTYFCFDLVLVRKVATGLYIFLFCRCLLCGRLCVILVGCRIPLYVLAFYARNNDMSWVDTFKWNASHHNSSMQMEAFYMLTLSSVVCEQNWKEID